MVDTLKGEAFGFLGFDLRRVHKRKKDGYTIQMTPRKKARKVVKAKIRDIIRSGEEISDVASGSFYVFDKEGAHSPGIHKRHPKSRSRGRLGTPAAPCYAC